VRSFFAWKPAAVALAAHLLCAAVARGERLPEIGGAAADPVVSGAFVSAQGDWGNSTTSGWSLLSTAFQYQDREQRGGLYGGSLDEGEWSDLAPICDACPRCGYFAFVRYDTWRGIPDGNWQNNGINAGLNLGTRLGRFSDWTGIGFQIGLSAGAYNWAGSDYRVAHQDDAQAQGFVTYGLFRKANEYSNWTGAIVHDWMLNRNYGLFAADPSLAQWRGQAGYTVSAWNELGIWGTWRSRGDTATIGGELTSWRAINQLNVYWHYKWDTRGADTWLWIGKPENDRMVGRGSLGDYTVGAYAMAPLNDQVSLTALVTYMHQSASLGPQGAKEDAWNFSIGLSFYPKRNSRTTTVAGQCWMPQLPVANNGYFLVDTNRVF
jgi:hypothetical protein